MQPRCHRVARQCNRIVMGCAMEGGGGRVAARLRRAATPIDASYFFRLAWMTRSLLAPSEAGLPVTGCG